MNISASELKSALKKLSPVKTETYRFEPDGICAQDSDVLIVTDGPEFGGSFSISRKELSQTVSRMSGQLDVSRFEKYLNLESGKAKIKLGTQTIKSIPLPEVGKKEILFSLPEFKKALSIAVASASPAKSAEFGGVVQIQSLPGGIEDPTPSGYRIVGTDSIILTVAEVKKPVEFEFKTLLNLTAASAVQLMDGEFIGMGETDKYVTLRSGNTLVYASKPVKKYPDFDNFLSLPSSVKYGFKSEDLMSALRTVEPLIDESVDKGAISLLFKDGVVQCSYGGTVSEASDEAPCEQLDPDPLFDPKETTIRMQAKYLSSFLSRASGPSSFGVTSRPIRMESDGVVVLTMALPEKK